MRKEKKEETKTWKERRKRRVRGKRQKRKEIGGERETERRERRTDPELLIIKGNRK
jgi:hypothetical protein